MPEIIEIQVQRAPSIECLRKLIALIEQLIERLEASAEPTAIPIRDEVMTEWVRQTRLLVRLPDPCTAWVCDDCNPGQFTLPASRRDLLEKLTHFLKVLDEHLPPPE